jgi:copper transport protein
MIAIRILAVTMGLLAHGAAVRTGVPHARLVSSEPAADSVMPAGLTWFRLVFSEPITSGLSGASLVATDGRTTALATAGDPRDVHALVAPVPPLDTGTYRMEWRIVSADGHPVKGSFSFRVGARPVADSTRAAQGTSPTAREPSATTGGASAGPGIASVPLIAALLRGAGIGALMALAGLLAFSSLIAPDPQERSHRLALRLAIAAPLLLAGHLVAWLINVSPAQALDAGSAVTALGTTLGRIEVLRVGLAILALAALALVRRERLALVLATASLLVSSAIGHPAAISPALAIPMKALHLLGVALWLGGLLWLVSADRSDPDGFVRTAGRVSSVALGAVAAVAISGLIQTVLFLPEIADIIRSAYGIGVLAKVAGLLALVLFGAHHRFRVIPRIADAPACVRMSRSVTREVAVMVVVVLLGGVLAYIPPPSVEGPEVARAVSR